MDIEGIKIMLKYHTDLLNRMVNDETAKLDEISKKLSMMNIIRINLDNYIFEQRLASRK